MKKGHKIRVKTGQALHFFQQGESLSRSQAIQSVQNEVELFGLHPNALRMIELFRIEPEELSEAGVSYELLKVLERRALFI